MMILALLSIGVMLAMSGYAYLRIRPDLARLPMQWSLKGTVNWTAPRPIALVLTPILFAVSMALSRLLGGVEENAVIMPMLAALGPLCHLLHIVLIATKADG